MSRTLNPQLFGTKEIPSVKSPMDTSMAVPSKKIKEMEMQIDVAQQKIDRLAQIHEAKFQQLMSVQKNLELQMRQLAEGISKQNATLLSRINERRVTDAKTQELVDRHQQLVNTFETRLAQAQKVSAEQEKKIMGYQATYDEVLREIRGLKR